MRRDSDEVIEPAETYRPRPWGPGWTAPQIIALLEPMVGDTRRERIQRVLGARLSSVTVLMDAPHDPHNGAAILRSCDAFGVTRAHVIPREEEFLASNVVSKGAERWVDVIQHASCAAAAETLHADGFELVCTHPKGELVPADLAGLKKVALVFGNEHAGIAPELSAAAKRSVRIPMTGFVESLNVSVSAALLLHAATANRPGDLTTMEHETLYAQGLFRSVNRAHEILRASRS